MDEMKTTKDDNSAVILLYSAWLIALLGTVGSLFYSEVMHYQPCALCWYQRIALYPLVIIIGIGIAAGDRRVSRYALPLSLIGLAVAFYHNLLYYGFIPESITPCSEGTPCNAVQLEMFGFVTIPLMALGAFLAIVLCLAVYNYKNKERK